MSAAVSATISSMASSYQSEGAVTTTASGYLALLNEPDDTLRAIALTKLLSVVDVLWHEIAEALPDLEALAEDTETTSDTKVRQTAAAVASRVFFHLEEPQQALRLALLAGEEYFDAKSTSSQQQPTSSPYVERLISAAFDAYVKARKIEVGEIEVDTAAEKKTYEDDGLTVSALQPFVHRLLENSCSAGKYDHALGIAFEARETDKVQLILQQSGPSLPLLRYTLQTATTCIASKQFRIQTYQVIANLWLSVFQSSPKDRLIAGYDLVTVYQLLYQADKVGSVLLELLSSSIQEEVLAAYQLCFDLMDTADQAFIQQVAVHIVGDSVPIQQALRVLRGGFYSELALSFLYKQSNADRHIMETLKKSLEERSSGSRSSILHNASVMAHAYLYAGTTNDSFLRDYLDWMKKASNWAKFSATASLGVVHASHATEAMQILQPYLPPRANGEDGVAAVTVPSTGGYAEGGSLYALGLIHGSNSGASAVQREETTEFLRAHLRASHANEVISHGACLGIGLAAMGVNDLNIINEIKEVLDTDSAVAGEAAGMAIGMVLVGSGAGNTNNSLPETIKEEVMEIIAELKNYARETQHEKIIRGIAMGLALMNYGQEENADAVIEEMRSDRDPIMRYGAQYAIALAYCGTGSNKAVRILLHTAVSDVSNDVRMAAVIGLAFVLYKTPERVPQLVKLLLESFNPHVRYAACMAVGIAMAGTGDSESIALLEPMLDDMTDYVRQGALLGTSMIYMQQSDTCNRRKIKSFRERLMSIVTEKHQSTLTKMGAILSVGIIDAGGRNCSLTLGSRNGFFTKMTSAVGLVLWLQHWHWYPMMHMLSLALTPTASIGLNKDFKYPKSFKLICNAKPSMFAYPKKLEEKKEEKKKRVETVTLSITVKEKARMARKKAKKGGSGGTEAMDVDKPEGETTTPADVATEESEDKGDAMDVEESVDATKEESSETPVVKKKKEPEPTSFEIGNPARITKIQSKHCMFDMTQRYRPVRIDEKPQSGVIMLTDTKPPVTPEEEDDDEENLGALRAPSLEPEGELPPPEPFVWTPSQPSVPGLSKVAEGTREDNEDDDEASIADDKISSAESSD